MSQDTGLELLPFLTRNGKWKGGFICCTCFQELPFESLLLRFFRAAVSRTVFVFIFRYKHSCCKRDFPIAKEFFYASEKNERILTRQKALQCLDRQTVIPSSCRMIAEEAFLNQRKLQTVEFPPGLSLIGNRAFQSCTALTEIRLPLGMEALGDGAFQQCSSLQTIYMPLKLTTINNDTFREDRRLQKNLNIGEWIINRAARIRCYRGSKVDEYCQRSGFTTEYIDE